MTSIFIVYYIIILVSCNNSSKSAVIIPNTITKSFDCENSNEAVTVLNCLIWINDYVT